jgi:hypothetical protein
MKEIKNKNILINNSMIIKVSNNNQKEKINKIELNNNSQNNMKLKSFNNTNVSNKLNKNISMNNSVYNFPVTNKKSLSVNKFIKLHEYKNMTLLNNFPNLMTISLSQGKTNKYGKNSNNVNNISSTFYSFKNNINKNIVPKKVTSLNNNSNSVEKDSYYKKNNYMSLLPNNYLGGYKTFFNKNNSNDKYNYDINTKYFKEELKKYKNSPPQNYYNNAIDENDEYNDLNNSRINTKSLYNNNSNNKYFKKNEKKDGKLMTKYKESNLLGKYKGGGKFGVKKPNAYGTMYNYGYGKKNNNIELPQLIQIYHKNVVSKNYNNNHYYGFSYNKKY